MGDGPDVAGPDAVHEHEPLLSGGEVPIEEEDETSSPDVNMKKTPAVDADHEQGVPSYEEVDLDSAALRAQGHEAALKRSFSPLAALGLGFRQVDDPIGILYQVHADRLLQYHQLMGWIPKLLRAEPRVWRPAERGLWAPGCHGRAVDHHSRAF